MHEDNLHLADTSNETLCARRCAKMLPIRPWVCGLPRPSQGSSLTGKTNVNKGPQLEQGIVKGQSTGLCGFSKCAGVPADQKRLPQKERHWHWDYRVDTGKQNGEIPGRRTSLDHHMCDVLGQKEKPRPTRKAFGCRLGRRAHWIRSQGASMPCLHLGIGTAVDLLLTLIVGNKTNPLCKVEFACPRIIECWVERYLKRDFPGGPVVKNPPYNAGDTDLIPGQGTNIPYAVGQLSPCVTTTELTRLN